MFRDVIYWFILLVLLFSVLLFAVRVSTKCWAKLEAFEADKPIKNYSEIPEL